MNMVYPWLLLWLYELTVAVEKWGRWSFRKTSVWLGLVITEATLMGLAVWLDSALVLIPASLLALATIPGQVHAWRFMRKRTQSSTATLTDATLSTAPTNPATGAGNSSETPDSPE